MVGHLPAGGPATVRRRSGEPRSHVLQWLIAGRPDPNPVDVWFTEGLPEAMIGGGTGGAIRELDELDDLTAEYGAISPIAFKTDSQITSPDAGEHFNYPMFQLAVEYLLDEDGYGRSPADARDVLIDVAEGASFNGNARQQAANNGNR